MFVCMYLMYVLHVSIQWPVLQLKSLGLRRKNTAAVYFLVGSCNFKQKCLSFGTWGPKSLPTTAAASIAWRSYAITTNFIFNSVTNIPCLKNI